MSLYQFVLNLFLSCIWVFCLNVYTHRQCTLFACRSHQRTSDSLDKELGMAVSAMCVVGTEPLFLKEQLVLLMMEPSL